MSIPSSKPANLSPSITSLGVGSNLDLNGIVTSLVAVEGKPITQLQAQATTLQAKISGYGQISSLMSTLSSTSLALKSSVLWLGKSVGSSNPSVVSASVGVGATNGNYAVSVQSLASAQTVVSGTSYSSATSLVGSGMLSLQLGSWSDKNTQFTPQADRGSTSIPVTSSDTLQSLVSKINGMGMGVTASLVSDASGVRLALSSSSTGSANGFRVTASDDDGSLAGVTYQGAGGKSSPGVDGMQLATAAGNANATINGIAVTSASNVVTGAVSGLTLTLNQVTDPASPVNMAVSSDTTSISSAIQAFVSAFNGLASYLQTATAYNANTKVAGDLQGDSAANGLQRLLRATLSQTTSASSIFASLSDVGLRFQKDGTISINQAALTSALNNVPEMRKAFTAVSAKPGDSGLATNFFNLAQQALGASGVVSSATSSLQSRLTLNTNKQTELNKRLTSYQQSLMAQYTALDSHLGKLNSLSNYVTQQLAIMNKKSS